MCYSDLIEADHGDRGIDRDGRLQAPIPIYASIAVVSFDPTRGFEISQGFIPPSQGIDQTGQILIIRSTQVMGNAARRLGMIPPDTPREKFSDFQSTIDQLIYSVFVSQDPTKPTAPIYISAASSNARTRFGRCEKYSSQGMCARNASSN